MFAMLIDRGERGLCSGLVLSYPEATPQGGFDGHTTRRHYCRLPFPRENETTPGVDRDIACDRNRVCAPTLRSRHSPRVTPRGSPLSRTALGSWDHAPQCPRDRRALPPRPALSNIHLPFPRAQACFHAALPAPPRLSRALTPSRGCGRARVHPGLRA